MLEILKNYHQISDRLHTSAQPTSEQFKIIKKSGVEIIINLALINSPNAIENEAHLVVENTMDQDFGLYDLNLDFQINILDIMLLVQIIID